jgi:flagellar protein FliJ
VTQYRVLQRAQQFFQRQERRCALGVAACERQMREGEEKLAELERYRLVYMRDFDLRAREGMNANRARTYQAFLVRIAQAVEEQRALLGRATAQHQEELRRWQAAVRRRVALDRIVQRHELEEHSRAEKTQQAAADAHAQRLWILRGARRGH